MMEIFNKDVLIEIGKQLLDKKETIAVGESVTAGLLQFAFSNIPDAATFFQGGLTAFNIGQKYKHLSVEPVHALGVNCVSQKVATEMATNICRLFLSDWGIGVTGYASITPQSGGKLFAYYAINYHGKIVSKGKITSRPAHPPEVQLFYVQRLLTTLKGLLTAK